MSDEEIKPAELPVVDTTAAEAEETQVVKTEEAKPEGEVKPEGEEDKRKREPGSVRDRRRAEMLRAENAELLRRLEETERKLPKGDGEVEQPPKEEDYNGDWTAYVAARAAFEAGKAVEKKLSAREVREREASQVDVSRERKIAHLERVDEAKEVITDFDQVMAGMKGATIRDDVLEEIISSEKSALLAYHLAKNPDTLRKLNDMSGTRELVREIGRLEGSVRMPSAKKQTSAPPPPTQVNGGAAPGFDASKASMAEYAAEFAKRMAAEAR